MEPLCKSISSTHRVLPDLKGLGAQEAIMDRLHEVAAQAKQILRQTMQREKSLSVLRR